MLPNDCWYCDENGNRCLLADLKGRYTLLPHFDNPPWVEVWVLGDNDGFGGQPVLGQYALHHGPASGKPNKVTPKMMGFTVKP